MRFTLAFEVHHVAVSASALPLPEPRATHRPSLVTPDDGRPSAIEEARQAEREATVRLRQLMTRSEERLRQSAGRLAEFDSMLETIRSLLWKDGYLRNR